MTGHQYGQTAGCASEWNGSGYEQYPQGRCKYCPSCNRIFCWLHAKQHQKYLRKKRMRDLL